MVEKGENTGYLYCLLFVLLNKMVRDCYSELFRHLLLENRLIGLYFCILFDPNGPRLKRPGLKRPGPKRPGPKCIC